MTAFDQWFEGLLVARIMAMLLKAVEWCLIVCCGAMALVAVAHVLMPMGSFDVGLSTTGRDPLPGAVLWFTAYVTVFTAFYAAIALVTIAAYRRYHRVPVWSVIRRSMGLLAIAAVLFVILIAVNIMST